MTNNLIILPMFAMVIVTLSVLTLLFRSRVASVKRGDIQPGFYKVYQGGHEPEYSAKLSRHLINIFEAPTLFYAVCIVGLAMGTATTTFQVLAWVYVAVRSLHAFIHIGANKIQNRIRIYMTGWVVLVALWGLQVYYVLSQG